VILACETRLFAQATIFGACNSTAGRKNQAEVGEEVLEKWRITERDGMRPKQATRTSVKEREEEKKKRTSKR
jgi:hypothetical protein